MPVLYKSSSFSSLLTTALGCGTSFAYALPLPAQAQTVTPSITAADDGTGTVIDHIGDTYTIEGGSLSSDGANQFHSFEQFGLAPTETANFVAPSAVSNIIGRVNGGQASVIDGTLSVTGVDTSPNLYLVNPAGILFGESATLNLPGSFTGTTADGIGFGSAEQQQWLANDTSAEAATYEALTGSPTAFTFSASLPGGIVNEGDLQLSGQQDAMLLGSFVANTGSISSPGGDVTLAAVPPETLVRISQPGRLLSYEVPASAAQKTLGPQTIGDPTWLAALLSHTDSDSANGYTEGATQLITNEDGTVSLRNSSIPLPVEAGHVFASGSIDVSDIDSADSTGGRIDVLGDRISVSQANLIALGRSQGGQIRIGGDYQGQGPLPTARRTWVDKTSTLTVDAIGNAEGIGDGGRAIVWADGATGFWGNVSANAGAQGGDGGFVEISGKEQLIYQGDVSLDAPYGEGGTLLFDPLDIVITENPSEPNDAEILDFVVNGGDSAGSTFFISRAQINALPPGSNFRLEATRNITFTANPSFMTHLSSGSPGNYLPFSSVTLRADADGDGVGDVTVPTFHQLRTDGADFTISGASLDLGRVDASQGGNINLSASDRISTFLIISQGSFGGDAGDVGVIAQNDIDILSINTQGFNGGDIFVSSATKAPNIRGSINAGGVGGPDGTITILEGTPPVVPDPVTVPESTLPVMSNPVMPAPVDSFWDPTLFSDPTLSSAFDLDFANYIAEENSFLTPGVAQKGGQISLEEIAALEQRNLSELSDYFGRPLFEEALDIDEVQALLREAVEKRNNRTAIVSVNITEPNANLGETEPTETQQQLELIVMTPEALPRRFILPGAELESLTQTASDFRDNLLTSVRRRNDSFMPQAQALYQMLVAPLADTLAEANIDTLLYSMRSGLRLLPIAALHDGEEYLIENYSVGMLPSLSLLNAQFDQSIADAQVLAMGASSFDSFAPLPGVPIEVDRIRDRWPGETFLNEDFTKDVLLEQRSQTPYELIHLATHAAFNPGDVNNSYIQLWGDNTLRLGDLLEMDWDSPTVDLLVLSACRTAVGSAEAEMGFAGLAVGAGVRSAVASVWSVSDLGTLALMDEFYNQLSAQPIKAEALRAAQLSMLHGQTELVDGQLVMPAGESISLPENLTINDQADLSHPYYWAGFTMIGSPW